MRLSIYFSILFVEVAFAEKVPRVWDDEDTRGYRLPLALLGKEPRMIGSAEYYSLPEVNLKTYPVYAPGKEPEGYIEWLQNREPEPLVDVSKLKTEAEWIAAGREVFYGRELPRFTGSEHNLKMIRDPRVVAAYRLQTTRDGVLLGLRYVVRQKGRVELGTDTCSMCHVQVTASGEVIEGPANVHTPFGPLMGDLTRRYAQMGDAILEDRRRKHMREDYRVPFLDDDENLKSASWPAERIAQAYERHPLGVHGRTGTSLDHPVKIANLIGLQNYRYFDRTGTSRHRNIGDLMRYAALVGDVIDASTRYGEGPVATLNQANMGLAGGLKRTPDPMIYALAKFIYSLRPPSNPNQPHDSSRRGAAVFERARCGGCHSGEAYTNSRLTPVEGFQPSKDLKASVLIMARSVGTDPYLATKTRKGTGLYRVPSLRMLWLERAFLHDGSIGTLEELFDPARLQPTFRSSNWFHHAPAHAVTGHRFGLELDAQDRKDLIAFLKTL